MTTRTGDIYFAGAVYRELQKKQRRGKLIDLALVESTIEDVSQARWEQKLSFEFSDPQSAVAQLCEKFGADYTGMI